MRFVLKMSFLEDGEPEGLGSLNYRSYNNGTKLFLPPRTPSCSQTLAQNTIDHLGID